MAFSKNLSDQLSQWKISDNRKPLIIRGLDRWAKQLRTLDAVRIIRLLYPTTDIVPLSKADLKKSPRLQLLDTGIINYTLGIQVEMLAMTELNAAYRGAIMTHLITQELISLQQQTANKPFLVTPLKLNQVSRVV